MIKTVKPETLKTWLDAGEVYLIDVREPAEFRNESIEGSTLIPLAEFSGSKIKTDAKKIVIHCRSGMRSKTACERLNAYNNTLDIYNLEGGILAWNDANFAIERGGILNKKCPIPIDRQVQFIVGCLVFFGTVFGLIISKIFLIIPLIIGMGLTFAGVSGWCGMSKFLSNMPWNSQK